MRDSWAPVAALSARAYTIPTDAPEADGTIAWDKTTIVVVHVDAGGMRGLGYTYTDGSAATLIGNILSEHVVILSEHVVGRNAMDPPGAFRAMRNAVRNIGRDGVVATAISAADVALWDVKAKLLDLPLALLLGRYRDYVPIYGSGGFTTYTDEQLSDQLSGWIEREGCRMVKMKIGADPARDPHRVGVAKKAIGDSTLFVDANGAFSPREAVHFGQIYAAEQDVRWFEEPVSSDDLAGMRFVREHAPPTMDIAAGEYGYDADYFRAMLSAGAVDVQQADATRCGGVTGFMQAAALCDAFHTDLSGHCAPALHLHLACAAPRLRHLEWFHDHVRIERMLFDGAPTPKDGMIRPDLACPGLGLTLKDRDAERYAA